MNGGWGRGLSAGRRRAGLQLRATARRHRRRSSADAIRATSSRRWAPRSRARCRRAASTPTTPDTGYVSAYDVNYPAVGVDGRGVVDDLRGAAVARRRIRVDRLRLSRRADAVRLAVHQLALRHHGHLRLPEGQLLLLPGVVERPGQCCTCSRTGTGRARRDRRSTSGCHSNLDRVELLPQRRQRGRAGRARATRTSSGRCRTRPARSRRAATAAASR